MKSSFFLVLASLILVTNAQSMQYKPRKLFYSDLSHEEQKKERISDCCSAAFIACRIGVNLPIVITSVVAEQSITLCTNSLNRLNKYLDSAEKIKRD